MSGSWAEKKKIAPPGAKGRVPGTFESFCPPSVPWGRACRTTTMGPATTRGATRSSNTVCVLSCDITTAHQLFTPTVYLDQPVDSIIDYENKKKMKGRSASLLPPSPALHEGPSAQSLLSLLYLLKGTLTPNWVEAPRVGRSRQMSVVPDVSWHPLGTPTTPAEPGAQGRSPPPPPPLLVSLRTNQLEGQTHLTYTESSIIKRGQAFKHPRRA